MFVRGANPIWFFDDLVGSPFDDTYYAFFLTNDLPYVPQAVYQDPNGTIPWSNPVEFQPSSGLPNNLYFNPEFTYRIEMRQGPTQSDPLIYLIENYVPGSAGGSSGITDELQVADNLITNPQFYDVYFSTPSYTFTKTSSGTYTLPIGPGWNLVLVGSGTVVVTQGVNAGSAQTTQSPPYFPYYLTINSSGSWTSVQLIQTFANNGAIFNGGAIGLSFAANATGSNQLVTVFYKDSNGSTVTLESTTVMTGSLLTYGKATNIGYLVNPNSGTSAFVNIVFTLPNSGIVSLTNIQLTGQSTPMSPALLADPTNVPEFRELTYEKNVNEEFHVYRDAAVLLPKASLLVGWNFGLNPFQFTFAGAPTVTTTTPTYVADQTIFKAEQASSVQVAFDAAVSGNIEVASIAATTQKQFCFMQYIDPSTMYGFWGTSCSIVVRAYLNTITATPVYLKARLFWSSASPTTLGPTEPIASYDANGDPVFSNNWLPIISPNDNKYALEGADPAHPFTGFPYVFENFTLPSGLVGQTLGIIVYIVGNLQASAGQTLVVNSISLVPNSFAVDATPQSADEVLRQCEYYYEKSYDVAAFAGANTAVGQVFVPCPLYLNGGNDGLYYKSFQLKYKTVKRTIPVTTFYSPTSASGQVQTGIYLPGTGYTLGPANQAITNWTSVSPSTNSIYMRANTASQIGSPVATNAAQEGHLLFQYTADARLGLV